MSKTPTLVLATLAVAAGAPLAAGLASEPAVHSAGLHDFPAFDYATIAVDHLRGSIAATQRTRSPHVDAFVSLHGLAPGAAYAVAISGKRCGKADAPAGAMVDLFGSDVERLDATQDDFFRAATARVKGRLARAASIRVYEGARQVACARAIRVR
jgi:hypothetical protein